MTRLAAILWIFSAAMVAVVLYVLKYEVQSLERELQMVNRQIVADQEAIHALKAEWSFLNQPAKIAELAGKHLSLRPLDTSQIVAFDQIPGRPIPGVKPLPPLPRAPYPRELRPRDPRNWDPQDREPGVFNTDNLAKVERRK